MTVAILWEKPMFSDEVLFFAIVGFGALAVATIIYMILDPIVSGANKVEKRKNLVAGGTKARQASRDGVIEQTRRKHVQDALNEMEEKARQKQKVNMRLRLQRAGLETVKVKTFYVLSFISALLFSLILFAVQVPLYVVAVGPLVGGVGIPRYILHHLTKKRQKVFLKEFVNAIDIIIRGVKAGLPFNDCLQIITTEIGEPVRSEFVNLVEQQKVGVPVEQALQKLYERIPLQEVNFFSIVVTIQLQVGGNISEALTNLTKVLRDRHKLRAKVQAVSTEAKASAAIIGCLPLFVMGAVSFARPDYMELLFTHPTGHMILAIGAASMLIGSLVMRWMINFKI